MQFFLVKLTWIPLWLLLFLEKILYYLVSFLFYPGAEGGISSYFHQKKIVYGNFLKRPDLLTVSL